MPRYEFIQKDGEFAPTQSAMSRILGEVNHGLVMGDYGLGAAEIRRNDNPHSLYIDTNVPLEDLTPIMDSLGYELATNGDAVSV